MIDLQSCCSATSLPIGSYKRTSTFILNHYCVIIFDGNFSANYRSNFRGGSDICWTELGAEVVGKIQLLLVSCRLHGVDQFTYLVDVLQRIDSHPATDVDQLTPRLWKQNFNDNPLMSDLERGKYVAH